MFFFCDLEKAFDKVEHRKLIGRLAAEGIMGYLADWIHEWLTNRSHAVVINGHQSPWLRVGSGLPQGTVLAPLLFSIFIKGFCDSCHSHSSKFADDTKTASVISGWNDGIIAQRGIDQACAWSHDWQIPINIDKVQLLHFGVNNPWIQYRLECKELQADSCVRDLGVFIDDSFSFTKHCCSIVSKANSLLYLLNRTITSRDKKVYLKLFCSIVRPILEYGVPFWEPLYKKDRIAIENIQRKMTKQISLLRNLAYSERLRILNLHSLWWRRRRNTLIWMFRTINDLVPGIPNTLFQLRNDAIKTRGTDCKIFVKHIHTL
jgi:hypothetical protein